MPNKLEWLCMSDVAFDEYGGRFDVENRYMQMVSFYRCPVSDHLWFFWDGFDAPPVLYERVSAPGAGTPDVGPFPTME